MDYWGSTKIDATCDDTHVALTCRNHKHLRWFTKNIGHIGARGIWFDGDTTRPNAMQGMRGDWVQKRIDRDGYYEVEPGRLSSRCYDMADYEFYMEGVGFIFECECPFDDLVLASNGQHFNREG